MGNFHKKLAKIDQTISFLNFGIFNQALTLSEDYYNKHKDFIINNQHFNSINFPLTNYFYSNFKHYIFSVIANALDNQTIFGYQNLKMIDSKIYLKKLTQYIKKVIYKINAFGKSGVLFDEKGAFCKIDLKSVGFSKYSGICFIHLVLSNIDKCPKYALKKIDYHLSLHSFFCMIHDFLWKYNPNENFFDYLQRLQIKPCHIEEFFYRELESDFIEEDEVFIKYKEAFRKCFSQTTNKC